MVYRVALCDDNKAFLSQLEEEVNQYCRKHQIDVRIQSFDDSDSLLEMIEEKRMHEIYILDIQMNPSGMTLVDEIHKISDTPYIILLTAFEEYAIEACGKGVFSYILKEEAYTRLPQTLDRLFLNLKKQEAGPSYVINNQRKFVEFRQNQIIYAYKDARNVIFVLENGKQERERASLQDVYEKLDHSAMVLIDRGIVLNLRYIKRIQENRIELAEGHTLEIRQIHAAGLKRSLHEYWGIRL